MTITMSSRAVNGTAELDQFYEAVKRIHGRALWQTAGTSKKPPTVP